MNEITIGVYIFNPDGLLLITHPNEVKADIWGIPKGRPDRVDEFTLMTGIREVYEETGIDLHPHYRDIEYAGAQNYERKPKTLIAYKIRLPYFVPEDQLKCCSTFQSRYSGKMIPEVDKYKWANFNNVKHKIQKEQVMLWERHMNGNR